jgi:S-DNA-T family DNA segregation ATPase FtsK/SpoIIIE
VEDRSYAYILGGTFMVVAFMLFVSILIHLLEPPAMPFYLMVLEVPGSFLFRSFRAAAFFVPLYLTVSAALLTSRNPPAYLYRLLNLLIIPFFTVALLLRLYTYTPSESAPIIRFLTGTLTIRGAIAFSALLIAVEGVVLVRYYRRLLFPEAPEKSEEYREEESDRGDSPEGSQGLLEDMRGGGSAEADLTEEQEERRSEGAEEAPGERRGALTLDELKARLNRYDYEDSEESLEDDEIRRFDIEEADIGDGEVEELDIEEVEIFSEESGFEEEPSPEDDIEAEVEGTTFVFSGGRITETPRREGDRLGEQQLPGGDSGEELEAVAPRRGPSRPPRRKGSYEVPIEGLLNNYDDTPYWELDDETRRAADVLRVTLEEFSIQAEVTGIRKGPVITMFEILPAPGVKLAKITNLADNIALRLAASSVRIVAPIPGKHAVGIEIPNKRRNIVSFAELIMEEEFTSSEHQIPVALGKDIPGDAQIVDLTKTPHLLIAGATGSGKSVCVNSIICSILYRRTPEEVKMILIDPKIVELKFYNDIPHLLTPVITDPKKAFQALQYCLYEMERRYSLLDSLQVRDVASYNEKIKARNLAAEKLPYIVVLIDEFADLMQTTGKELESTVARLAAMSRAVGIHIVLATQRPSTDVITGLIKANIPSRIAFMVASKVDSRIIIDAIGAEKLLGRGDMLFTSAWDPFPFRMQGAFLSEEEVERVVEHVKTLGEPEYIDDEIFIDDDDETYGQEDLEDPLMEQAIEIVVSANKASASYLQRRLKIGYNRAARLVEEMERIGIVGPQNGSKPREIIPR